MVADAASPPLRHLSARYAGGGDAPAGEAFHRAFKRYLKANRESLFDITLTVTTASISLPDGPESVDPLLLKAIETTNPSLTQERLFNLDGEALQGAVNTAKGKYFEYLVVERLNNGEQVGPLCLADGLKAELAESVTQPGWDLRIVDADGRAVEYLQLKATDSVGYIRDALERYPDVQILATSEVAHSGLVLDSGLSDAELQRQVADAVGTVGDSVTQRFLDYFGPLFPLVAMATLEGYKLAVGRQSLDAFKLSLARRGQRIIAANLAGASVYALDGGLLSVPAAFAGGLLFDRALNQAAILQVFAHDRERLLALRLMQQERELAGVLR